MADQHFAPIILRFGTIYGLSGRTRFDLVVNLLAAKAIVDRAITVFDGDQWRPFVHVDDAALAIFKVLEAPQHLVSDQIFNVGSDEQNYTIHQVGEIIHAIVPGAQLVDTNTITDRRNYRVNFSKIRHTLGFVPQRTIEYGIRQVIDAIAAGRVRDYREAKYSNVKFLGEGGTALLVRRENVWARELINEIALAQDGVTDQPAIEQPLQAKAVGG
jgi:nucleoside-diphosphate-sugar epimerase